MHCQFQCMMKTHVRECVNVLGSLARRPRATWTVHTNLQLAFQKLRMFYENIQRVRPPPKTCCDYIFTNIECLRQLCQAPACHLDCLHKSLKETKTCFIKPTRPRKQPCETSLVNSFHFRSRVLPGLEEGAVIGKRGFQGFGVEHL